MNQRQWKKANKKAAAELERLHPGMYKFTPSDGTDATYGDPGYRPTGRYARKHRRSARLYPCAPKGMPLIFACDYWGEWDVQTPLQVLREHELWDDFEPDDEHVDELPFNMMLDETCRSLWFVLSKPQSLEVSGK